MEKIKVALIGFGGIARIHYNAYKKLQREGSPLSVVAVCEKNVDSVRKNVTINLGTATETLDDSIHIYADVDELIGNEDFDVADICLPSFLHKEMTVKLLLAGKHVFCEKPMALCSEDCEEMLSAADVSGKRLMIGQCVRFDPLYLYLKKCVDNNLFGELKYMTMHRLSEYPRWSPAFSDLAKTGGCTIDTHVHDIDVARYILGDPLSVSATEFIKLPYCQVVHSRLDYKNCTVLAECCWDESRAVKFESGYRAIFENATVVYDGNSVKVYENGKEPYEPDIEMADEIVEELRAFSSLVQDPTAKNKQNDPKDSCLSIKLIEKIKESARLGGECIKLSL